jgi:alpha-1,6-mannosyltransferase
VTDAVGRLGPVGDSDAMAANILAVWNGDRSTIAANARHHALQFGWERSMDALFGHLYPAAFQRRARRRLAVPAAAAVAA